jgi:hypothetical protein
LQPALMPAYQVPSLLADLNLLDLIELSGSTVKAAPLLNLSQPSVSRRRRRLQKELGLMPTPELSQGDGACLRLLRRAAKRHRLDSGVWRLGGDGWALDPQLMEENVLLGALRFAPLAQWQTLVQSHVLDGALVSGHELRVAGLNCQMQEQRPVLWRSCIAWPLLQLPLLLVRRGDAPPQPAAIKPWSTVLMPSLGFCAGLAAQLRQQQFILVHLSAAQQEPAEWLCALEQNRAAAALVTPMWFQQLQRASKSPLHQLAIPNALNLDLWLLLHRRDWSKHPELQERANALARLFI